MLTSASMNQTCRKLQRFLGTLQERIFIPVGKAENMRLFETTEPLFSIPSEDLYRTASAEDTWGGEGVYGWIRCEYTVPSELNGQALFVYPKTTFYESTLWVDGRIHSNFAAKFIEGSHGNHYCNRLCAAAPSGHTYVFDLECYAYHVVPGTQPLSPDPQPPFYHTVGSLDICTRDDELMDFYFDLSTILELRSVLPEMNAHRAALENTLYQAHLLLHYDPKACDAQAFREGIRKAAPLLKAALSVRNGDQSAWIGLIGHSHMDTAWLWPLRETYKKCARTYANQLNLMEEYPEYRFVQSSAYHSEIIRRYYPELFSRIQKAVAEGRYEPNGGVWVECDCNLTGGEYMVRQFVWGQRFTQKYFGYTADSFWLPDTFGYSFAIPQIMKGCRVDYFLTTKIGWNDTTVFPYTSFYWQGLDGTRVLTHMNRTHAGPTPQNLINLTSGGDGIREMRTSPMRLFSFGKGDGGGGPEFEMLESARRLQDLQDLPRSGYTTVSGFMHQLEETIVQPSVYADELYLEGHRGTLTNQHNIKRNNRMLEIALHNLELALVMKAVKSNEPADEAPVNPMMETLLVRQFHDILPGTCIHTVHEETCRVMTQAISDAQGLLENTLKADSGSMTLFNPLSFTRKDTVYLPGTVHTTDGKACQSFTDLAGNPYTAVSGLSLPAFSNVLLEAGTACTGQASPFLLNGNTLITPYARVRFNDNGFMESFVDLSNNRELVGGLPFGTFLFGEDVSASWDNWDIDADLEEKLVPCAVLESREIAANGPVELRIRCRWSLGSRCGIEQDIIFDASSPMVSFDTYITWNEEHHFLKAAFDTSLLCDGVRSEIQFGNIRRSNHRSTVVEKARFETCNHKYSDLSENSYGVALLNDCKYGISVQGGSMHLSLHKGGILPDTQGDKGIHHCRYAILPHNSGFSAESVVQPAYCFNYRPVFSASSAPFAPLVTCTPSNVIVETVKPCEDTQRAFILRLYESVGDYTRPNLVFTHSFRKICLCNMLEEETGELDPSGFVLHPFQIQTLKVYY